MNNCVFQFNGEQRGKRVGMTCAVCGRRVFVSKRATPESVFADCSIRGVGTELHCLLHECGLYEEHGCNCNEHIRQMNRWGIAGCREHRETILAWLREAAAERGWGEKLRAGAAMAAMGINPLAPYDSLLDEAIRRAELTQPAAPAV